MGRTGLTRLAFLTGTLVYETDRRDKTIVFTCPASVRKQANASLHTEPLSYTTVCRLTWRSSNTVLSKRICVATWKIWPSRMTTVVDRRLALFVIYLKRLWYSVLCVHLHYYSTSLVLNVFVNVCNPLSMYLLFIYPLWHWTEKSRCFSG